MCAPQAKTGRHYSSFLPPELLPFAERAWGRRDHTTSRLQVRLANRGRRLLGYVVAAPACLRCTMACKACSHLAAQREAA